MEARWARRSVSRESEGVVVVEVEGFGFGGAGEEEGILSVGLGLAGVLCTSRGVWKLVWLYFVLVKVRRSE